MRNAGKLFIAVWLLGWVFGLAVWGGVIFVVIHFVRRFW